MDKIILVAYGSKRGSTAEIAEKIGEIIRQIGLQVDVLDAGTVNDQTPYSTSPFRLLEIERGVHFCTRINIPHFFRILLTFYLF